MSDGPNDRPNQVPDDSHGVKPTLDGFPAQPESTPTENWIGAELSDGRYRVTEKLGEGGMGAVYRAIHERLETDVVIKVPHAYLLRGPGFLARFEREIRSLVRLSHPHVCPIMDVGDEGGVPFAVMKYLGGGNLQSRRPRDPGGREAPMTVNQFLRWVTNIAQALDFIHAQGYVHRDVKPSNILFDAHGNVYLSDFGIVRAAAGVEQPGHTVSLTGTGAVLGTPEYMAPELIMGHEYDGRVDQYALGIVVYELLAVRRPFSGPNPSAIMVEQATVAPPDPRELNRSIPGPIGEVVLKALSKKPEERYAKCMDLVRAIVEARKQPARRQAKPAVASSAPPKAVSKPREKAVAKPPPARREASQASQILTNSIGMKQVLVPAGEYMMGSPESEEERRSDEQQNRVRIARPFYLGVYEVTQEQYEQVMGTNPSHFRPRFFGLFGRGHRAGTRPVEMVSWGDAVEFCRKLSSQEGRTYRLPTEAEWEYACRAGTQTPFHFGRKLNGREANCDGNYPYGTRTKGPYLKRTTDVGSYDPNAWGLYDMHGNVWEWCQDWWAADYYANSPADDPQGPASGSSRVRRGGCWNRSAGGCRSAYRFRRAPGLGSDYLGFRVALVPAD